MFTRRTLLISAIWIVAIACAHALDWWALESLAIPSLAETDLGRMLRVLGYVPLWLCVGIAIALCEDPTRRRWHRLRRGTLIVGAAVIGGIVAELAKIIIRRERPDLTMGVYSFRAWSDQTLHTGGLGMPSSHALVALAALAMMCHLFPRARILWIVLGAGCALSRIATGAHFLSDVVASAAIGHAVAALMVRTQPINSETRS